MVNKELETLKKLNVMRRAIRKNTTWRKFQQWVLLVGVIVSLVIFLYWIGNILI